MWGSKSTHSQEHFQGFSSFPSRFFQTSPHHCASFQRQRWRPMRRGWNSNFVLSRIRRPLPAITAAVFQQNPPGGLSKPWQESLWEFSRCSFKKKKNNLIDGAPNKAVLCCDSCVYALMWHPFGTASFLNSLVAKQCKSWTKTNSICSFIHRWKHH